MTYEAYLQNRNISEQDLESFLSLMRGRKGELEKKVLTLKKQLHQMELMRDVHQSIMTGLGGAARDLSDVLAGFPKEQPDFVTAYQEKLDHIHKLKDKLKKEKDINPDYLLLRKLKEIEMVHAELDWIEEKLNA